VHGEEGADNDLAASIGASKPHASSTRDEREAFIAAKYQRKAFLSKSVLSKASLDPREHVVDLFDQARRNDVMGVLTALALGVKVDDTLATAASSSSSTNAASGGPQASPDSGMPGSPLSGGSVASPAPSPTSSSVAASAAVSPAASEAAAAAAVLGTRALHVAAASDSILSLELLLQNNAREGLLNELGQTALQVAVAHHSTKCQARLTKPGAKKA
jgi:hypothetical protein